MIDRCFLVCSIEGSGRGAPVSERRRGTSGPFAEMAGRTAASPKCCPNRRWTFRCLLPIHHIRATGGATRTKIKGRAPTIVAGKEDNDEETRRGEGGAPQGRKHHTALHRRREMTRGKEERGSSRMEDEPPNFVANSNRRRST